MAHSYKVQLRLCGAFLLRAKYPSLAEAAEAVRAAIAADFWDGSGARRLACLLDVNPVLERAIAHGFIKNPYGHVVAQGDFEPVWEVRDGGRVYEATLSKNPTGHQGDPYCFAAVVPGDWGAWEL